ncbi:MAG: HPr family phosphocarrier protein [Chloroflexi bacterium]|nr:HPr family phosphocarrier protein [Chloroflexota bacterium]
MTTLSVDLIVRHPEGLHARPAAAFVRQASAFQAELRIQNLSRNTAAQNAKSLVAVLSAAANCGHRVRLTAGGPDAAEAVAALSALLGDPAGPVVEADDDSPPQ